MRKARKAVFNNEARMSARKANIQQWNKEDEAFYSSVFKSLFDEEEGESTTDTLRNRKKNISSLPQAKMMR